MLVLPIGVAADSLSTAESRSAADIRSATGVSVDAAGAESRRHPAEERGAKAMMEEGRGAGVEAGANSGTAAQAGAAGVADGAKAAEGASEARSCRAA